MKNKYRNITVNDFTRRCHHSPSPTTLFPLNQHDNNNIQSCKNPTPNVIAVLVPEIKHHFFSAAIDGIEEIMDKNGYATVLCVSNEDVEREIINVHSLISNGIAGLIVSLSQTTLQYDHFNLINKHSIPIIFFDRVTNRLNYNCVLADDFDGAYQATAHLINRGYKHIAHLAGPQHLSIGRERLEGYRAAMFNHQFEINPDHLIINGLDDFDGKKGIQQLLTTDQTPDAILAVNGAVLMGAYLELKAHGINIPKEMALIGFTDNPLASLVDPPLSAIIQPAYEMGVKAAEMLIDEIEFPNQRKKQKTLRLKTKLQVRNST